MTEVGEKWVMGVLIPVVGDDPLKRRFTWIKEADCILSAFCEEVKNTADNGTGTVEERVYDAFMQLKRELLGGLTT